VLLSGDPGRSPVGRRGTCPQAGQGSGLQDGVAGRSFRATKNAEEDLAEIRIIPNQLTPTGSHEIARGFNPWHACSAFNEPFASSLCLTILNLELGKFCVSCCGGRW
jgi:hypothetical protein